MELYYLMSITDRDRAEDMAALYRDAGLNLVTTMLGRGTATPQQLALYGLSRTEKAVTGAVVGTDSMKQLFRAAKRKLFIDIPGNGLMLAVPLKSVSSGRTLAYLTDGGKSATGGVPTMNFDYELIVVQVMGAIYVVKTRRNSAQESAPVFSNEGVIELWEVA